MASGPALSWRRFTFCEAKHGARQKGASSERGFRKRACEMALTAQNNKAAIRRYMDNFLAPTYVMSR
jgi:hypothetical protein